MKCFLSVLATVAMLALGGTAAAQAPAAPAAPDAKTETPAAAAAAPATAATAEPAAPAAAPAAAPKLDSGDTAWMLTSTMLVILMTIPGLALFYGGLARSKNMLSVLMQVFVIFSLISILWAAYGYSLAFAGEGRFFASFDKVLSVVDTIAESFRKRVKTSELNQILERAVRHHAPPAERGRPSRRQAREGQKGSASEISSTSTYLEACEPG